MIRVRRILAFIGAATRARLAFALRLAALVWGVARESAQPRTWRRTVRQAFRAALVRIVCGSLGTVAVTGLVVGLGLVFEALYWLRTAGEQGQIGRILVVSLVREITPLLIGVILLGRGGAATVAEFGLLAAEGEAAVLRAEGIDLFQVLVLPRALAFAVAAFSLGVVFVLLALVSGFITGSLSGVVTQPFLGFLDVVLRAMTFGDLAVFPAKLVLIGLVLALSCCATGLAAGEDDGAATLLPRGFTRGIAGILTVTILLSAIL